MNVVQTPPAWRPKVVCGVTGSRGRPYPSYPNAVVPPAASQQRFAGGRVGRSFGAVVEAPVGPPAAPLRAARRDQNDGPAMTPMSGLRRLWNKSAGGGGDESRPWHPWTLPPVAQEEQGRFPRTARESLATDSPDARPTLLFRREFLGFTGGHLKVRHYFGHAMGSARFRPAIHFTPNSTWGPENPWLGIAAPSLTAWEPEAAGALFLGGLDWEAVPASTTTPVVNLIQGLGHAQAGDPKRRFLARPAVRICVSPEVAEAILATGEVNGPVVTIPNGLDAGSLPPPAARRDLDLLVSGFKNPSLARAIAAHFASSGLDVELLLHALPRREYASRLGRAEVAVTIPTEAEGFFLPALEAMAMGAIVVCPDCIGNRSFCRDGVTCLRPAYRVDAIVAAVEAALRMTASDRVAMRLAAVSEVEAHSLERERRAFLAVLDGFVSGG